MPLQLLENEVHTGVIIELCTLLENETKTGVLPAQTAGFIMKQARRDTKSGEITDEMAKSHKHGIYSEALLQRLADLRSRRKIPDLLPPDNEPRIVEYCVFVILEGGEDWPKEEYDQFLEEEEILNRKMAEERQAQIKKWNEEKAARQKKKETQTHGRR
jgi:hypothetical protein